MNATPRPESIQEFGVESHRVIGATDVGRYEIRLKTRSTQRTLAIIDQSRIDPDFGSACEIADYFVKAVNCHDDLVDLAHEVIKYLAYGEGSTVHRKALVNLANQAIAKAEGDKA